MLKRKAEADTRVNHLIAGRGIDWLTVKTRLKAQGAKGGKRNVAGLDPGPEASVRGDELSVIEGVKSYYSLLGVRGLAVVIKARLLRTRVKASVQAPGIPHPVHVRVRSSDIRVFYRILVTPEWEHPKSPRVIVDAGANIGLTSVFYANKHPGAKIFAIEPEPSNFELLKKNTASYTNVVRIQAALLRENEPVGIFDPGAGFWGFRTAESESESAVLRGYARGLTLDTD